jgi:dCTP deaminase
MFWSSEKFEQNGPQVVKIFCRDHLHHGAYELAVGSEVFLTSADDERKEILQSYGDSIVIPPGQFALLITDETVCIPATAIGFISMRFSIKQKGLINVSGFHVDPGYRNRLKFSVYNAGSMPITLLRGQRIFMLWLCDLDQETKDVYKGQSKNHDIITGNDQDVMRGKVSSPAQLRSELDDLKHTVENWKMAVGIFIALVASLLIACFKFLRDITGSCV